MSLYNIQEVAAGSVPNAPAGTYTLFLDTDGVWKKKDDTGTVTAVSQSDGNDQVKISGADTVAGFLEDKLNGLSGKIVVNKVNTGANETFTVTIGADVFDKTSDNSDNITEGTTKLLLTPAERTKIANALTSIVGLDHSDLNLDDGTNPHGTTKADVGLGNVDNTSDANKPVSTAQQTALNLKYDATNPDDFETPAQLNARDTANRNRANHTGTQVAATISDFDTEVANNTDVDANTSSRHDAVTVSNSGNINLSLTGQGLAADLTNTGITAGAYTNVNITVDAKGRITAITNGGAGSITQAHAECYFATFNTIDTVIANQNTPVKILGTTTFGFSSGDWSMPVANRLQWNGTGTVRVEVLAAVTFNKEEGGGSDNYTVYVAQTGAVLTRSKAGGRGSNNDNGFALSKCIADISAGQYFEVFIENNDDVNNLKASNLHLSVTQILN